MVLHRCLFSLASSSFLLLPSPASPAMHALYYAWLWRWELALLFLLLQWSVRFACILIKSHSYVDHPCCFYFCCHCRCLPSFQKPGDKSILTSVSSIGVLWESSQRGEKNKNSSWFSPPQHPEFIYNTALKRWIWSHTALPPDMEVTSVQWQCREVIVIVISSLRQVKNSDAQVG